MGHRLRRSALGDQKADQLVREAVEYFGVAEAGIGLVGKSAVYFVSEIGIGMHILPRAMSFSGFAIHGTEPLIVADATRDVRFADNPRVVGHPFVRFYAAAPLIDRDGYCLGSFCIADARPRTLAPNEVAHLLGLSKRAMGRIDFLSVISEAMFKADDNVLVRL
jgi:GAF domain-containing protein